MVLFFYLSHVNSVPLPPFFCVLYNYSFVGKPHVHHYYGPFYSMHFSEMTNFSFFSSTMECSLSVNSGLPLRHPKMHHHNNYVLADFQQIFCVIVIITIGFPCFKKNSTCFPIWVILGWKLYFAQTCCITNNLYFVVYYLYPLYNWCILLETSSLIFTIPW